MSSISKEELYKGISKGIVKYTSRDYESIMQDFWQIVPTMTELWKPEAEADPGVVLGKWLASIADMLGVNLDLLANELYAPTVSQRKNAEKLFGLIGYNLGWFTAGRTEITFTNSGESTIQLDLGFSGNTFCTVSANTDIEGNPRVITYNILPLTNKYGATDTRSRRTIASTSIDVFADTDIVNLAPGESITRVGIEGELRSYSISVKDVQQNNLIIKLPSQNIDSTAVWIKARASRSATEFLATQWVQCNSPAEFVTPEPRFAVTYDSYSNAQIQVSNYLNSLDNYENNFLTVYWFDCIGERGCINSNALTNFISAKQQLTAQELADIEISNLSNIVELPHTHVICGKSPETAKQAYKNSRNYINTWDSLITLPDFNRFLNREPGVDTGLVIDCQKALEINTAIYLDDSLTATQKSHQYINENDFLPGQDVFDWEKVLSRINYDPTSSSTFSPNFKTYVAMCYAIHNDFKDSEWGPGIMSEAQWDNGQIIYKRYKPPAMFIDHVIRDYRPLQAMSVELQFGYLRVFPFYVVGEIYPKNPVTIDVAINILETVREALRLYFAPANRSIGQAPTLMEIVKVIQGADTRIDYFDAGSLTHSVINWRDCDPSYFNPISFAWYQDHMTTQASTISTANLRIAPEFLIQS